MPLDEQGIEVFEEDEFIKSHPDLQLITKEVYRYWNTELYYEAKNQVYWEKGPWLFLEKYHFREYKKAKNIDVLKWISDIRKRRDSFNLAPSGQPCYFVSVFELNRPKAQLLTSSGIEGDWGVFLYFDPDTKTYWEKGPFFWRDNTCVRQRHFKKDEVLDLDKWKKPYL